VLQAYKGKLLYSQPHGQFYYYELEHPGLWSAYTKVEMMGSIREKLIEISLPNGFSANLMNDLFIQLQSILAFNKWYDGTNYLLFANGVLNVETKELLNFDKKLYLTQRMPYCYDPAATCDSIIKWLKFTQRNDWERVQVLRAWLRATLLGCYDIQKFVEIIGPGKSGKSTYANLAVALVGKHNTYSTDFNNLETNRFETIAFMNKKLLLFQDMDRWGGSVSKLKAITGGDWIRVERKFQAENPEPFQFHGLVMITANEAIQSTDYTSGLARRRLTIPFDRPFEGGPEQQRELIKFDVNGDPRGEFAALLPGLVNWLLDLTTEEMREYLMSTGNKVKYFKEYEKIQSLRSSPLLDWMEHSLCYVPGAACCVGFAKHAPPGGSGSYVKWNEWLYASYCEFCKQSNVNIMSRNRWEPLFFDVCQHQLKLNIGYKRNTRGLIVFNVALRDSGPGFEKYPSIVEVASDKEKFKEFYGEVLETKKNANKIEDENTTDE
jgi:putative DNA primase/helicase